MLVSRGLAVSAPGASDIRVDAAKALAERPQSAVDAATFSAPAPPVVTDTPTDTTIELPLHRLVTQSGLRQLVAVVTAHPAPLRPDVECIARTVYHEAANQALSGQLAVAQVIVNRTRSGEFPKSVCAVVGQRGQFSHDPVTPTSTASKPWSSAVAIATIAQEYRVAQIAPGALFFHAASMRPVWSGERERIAQIGDHIFYR